MTQHIHAVFDPTCFRCDLSAAEEQRHPTPKPDPWDADSGQTHSYGDGCADSHGVAEGYLSECERDLAMLKRQLALKERELQRLLVIEQRQGAVDDAARAFVEWHQKGQPKMPGSLYPMTYAQEEAYGNEWDKRMAALIEAVAAHA